MSVHTRLLGLDIGDVRIGVSISDELGMIASPLHMIPRKSDVLGTIQQLIEQYHIGGLVIGLPVGLSGREGPQAAAIRDYVATLEPELPVAVTWWDERLSTSIAERTLIGQKTRRDKRKQLIDSTAAAVILQGYLDRQRFRRG